ncbi:MAG: hypothetical protein Q8N36_06525, partial [bacterium]|nr:hypothetical protein [bacterium]
SPQEKLMLVVSHTQYTLPFFPSDWANLSDEELNLIACEDRFHLVERLDRPLAQGMEPWKKLHMRLLKTIAQQPALHTPDKLTSFG